MAESGPTQQELDEAKSYLKGSQLLSLDTSSKLASAMLQYQLDHLSIDYLERRNALVEAVTIEEAKQAARRLNICYKALLNKLKRWQIDNRHSLQSSLNKTQTGREFQPLPF